MNRRDFIKISAATSGAALAASCDQPVATKLISRLTAAKTLPGEAEFVRSICHECPAGCGVIAKIRDGHPVKLEGDVGGLCMRGQSALSRLYHPARLRSPMLRNAGGDFQKISWDEAFAILNGVLGKTGDHVFLSGITTGALSNQVDAFCRHHRVERLPEFELYSHAAIRKANALVFGRNALPSYDVKRADLLVTIGADVIETFLNPVQFARDLAENPAHVKWFHIEPHLSLTGANATERLVVRPGSEVWLLAYLADELGVTAVKAAEQTGLKPDVILDLAAALRQAKTPLLIVGGVINDLNAAVLGALLQKKLHAPLDWSRDNDYERVGSLADLVALEQRLLAGKITLAFLHDTNPAAYRPAFADALKKASFRIGTGDLWNATLLACDLVLPLSHALETDGAIKPLGETLSIAEIFQKLGVAGSATNFRRQTAREPGDVAAFLAAAKLEPVKSDRTLVIAPSIRTFDGRSDALSLLSEIPDPLTTVTYGAWVTVAEKDAATLGVKNGGVLEFVVAGKSFQFPARVMPAQPAGVFTVQRPFLKGVALPLAPDTGEELAVLPLAGVSVPAIKPQELPFLSGGMRAEGRGIVPSLEHDHKHDHEHEHSDEHVNKSLYPPHEHKNYRWAMAVDLERCTGCAACVAACYVENNIPLVGRDEHVAGREMSWIRIEPFVNTEGDFEFLPMMCQQCDNAPCEPVCPVLATYHNPEGLNAQVYNRCVGTRYCSNNCPYKVRRFNWIDHPLEKPLELMVNPDVSRRPRGVMEKCTFCVHRITKAKDHAKDEGRLVRDGEVTTACAQSCPAQAIVFGNILDEKSEVHRWAKADRQYRVLEELGVEPAVYYLKPRSEA